VTLFHAIRGFSSLERRYEKTVYPGGEQGWIEMVKQGIEPVIEKATRRFLLAGWDPKLIRTKIAAGVDSRADSIVSEVREGGYGTIVLGRKGLTEVRDFTVGQVARKVFHIANEEAIWLIN
jgi:hypothetical protein